MWQSTRSAFVGALLLAVFVATPLRGEIQDRGEKSLTPSAEIARGSSAMRSIEYAGYLRSFLRRLFAVVSENQRRGSASDGFLLGANYEIWQRLGIALAVEKEGRVHSPSAVIAEAQAQRVCAFEEFRRKQRELGVSDADFCSALGLLNVAYIMSQIEEWERAQAAQAEAAKSARGGVDKDRRTGPEKRRTAERKSRPH